MAVTVHDVPPGDAVIVAEPRKRRPQGKLLSVVIPMHNEQEGLAALFDRLVPVLEDLPLRYEIVCVNDGSRDDTLDHLLALRRRYRCLRVVDLSRNFGKEAALTAGLDHARGDAVVPIDADLQDPPELVQVFVQQWLDGYDVVYGVRSSRPGDGVGKRLTAHLFYRLFNVLSDTTIPADTGDFRLMDRRVVVALRQLPERNRFSKGLFAWVGFRQIGVAYDHADRVAGRSKWRLWRLWNYAIDGITAFSTTPLRIWTYLGLAIAACAFAYALAIVAAVLIGGRDVPGYASLIVVVLFLGGIQLIGLGVIGEYIGRIYQETKARPTYLVDRVYGDPPPPIAEDADADAETRAGP